MHTIKDVAKLAGVSIATVSMVINHKAGISDATKEKVQKAIIALDYSPNISARKLIKQRSKTIGLLITDITNPFFGMIVAEVNKYVLNMGYLLSLAVSNDNPQQEKECILRFIEERVEGIIIIPSIFPQRMTDVFFSLKASKIPFIFLTTTYENVVADSVMCDLASGSYELTKYLLNQGKKRIYFLTGERDTIFTKRRVEGVRQAFEEAQIVFDESWIVETLPYYQNGYDETKRLIDKKPDAIITVNDHMAMGVLKCLKDHGIRVPEDISVAGYDDIMYSGQLETPLTTVRQPTGKLAKKGVEMLFSRIQNPNKKEEQYLIKPTLKLRDTT